MGTLPTASIMIKTLLASALFALTAAEADPQLLYGAGLPYAAAAPLPYVGATVGAVAHVPVVKVSEVNNHSHLHHLYQHLPPLPPSLPPPLPTPTSTTSTNTYHLPPTSILHHLSPLTELRVENTE